jgi:hypothetical protein
MLATDVSRKVKKTKTNIGGGKVKTRGSPNPRREGIATYSVFKVIWGPTDQPMYGQTNIVSYRGATSRLKNIMLMLKVEK